MTREPGTDQDNQHPTLEEIDAPPAAGEEFPPGPDLPPAVDGAPRPVSTPTPPGPHMPFPHHKLDPSRSATSTGATHPGEHSYAKTDQPARKTFRPLVIVWAVLACLFAGVVFAGGFLAGARDPFLAPVQLVPPAAGTGQTAAEQVYQVASQAVVTIQVPGTSTGTGFFYRPDRIVTNAHVVSSPAVLGALAERKPAVVDVYLADGRLREATVIGLDSRLDVAVLSVEAGLGVKPLAFSDSTKVAPGQPAFVVGAPFGLATSITTGVISGVDRNSVFAADPVQSALIQTDAAVNPGNSGGPLLDASATVVGVVTLRPDEAGGRSAQGLAFAVPSKNVVAAIEQLEKYGHVAHPYLGVHIADPDPDDKTARYAEVVKVAEGSPADKAGVRVGDQLVSVAGKKTTTAAEVVDAVTGKRPGQRVEVVLWRAGKKVTVQVRLGERPSDT
jgi:putative serine protease PepD